MKKTLFAILAVVLSVGMMGSAFAYFSDTAASTANIFTAGTLDLQLSNDGSAFYENVTQTWVSPSGWAPGQKFSKTLWVKNNGNVDATYLGIDWNNLGGTAPSMADYIQITYWHEFVPGFGEVDELGADQHYQTLVGNGDSVLTLKELMQSYIPGTEPLGSGGFIDEFGNRVNHLTDSLSGNGYDTTPVGTPAIAAGQTYWFTMEFTFMATAGNELQGKTCTFDVSLMAAQDISQLP